MQCFLIWKVILASCGATIGRTIDNLIKFENSNLAATGFEVKLKEERKIKKKTKLLEDRVTSIEA